MRSLELLTKLKNLNAPIWQTRDVVAYLNLSTDTATKALTRLMRDGHILKLRAGLWAFSNKIEALMLPEYLTAPFPSYISLQSALYYHGMIEQIPEIVYAVSLARAKRFKTPLGLISIHHLPPELYFGYDIIGTRQIKMAVPEKALLDFLYLSTAKTRFFVTLPELELPKNFNHRLLKTWFKKIPAPYRIALVKTRLDTLKVHIKF